MNRKVFFNENDTEKHTTTTDVKNGKSNMPVVKKRVILGDLQNRGLLQSKTGKDVQQKDLKNVKLPGIRETKPSLESLRKKSALSTNVSKASSSAKKLLPTKISLVSEIKTVTTKMLENKLQKVKIVDICQKNSTVSRKTVGVKTVSSKTKSVSLKSIPSKSYSKARIVDVRNIDEDDKECLILVSEYVNDIYDYLFQMETEQPIHKHHLANQKSITPEMRAILLDWINEVHSQFHLVTETFYIAIDIIDRYLQEITDTKRTELQLLGTTALFLAAKYEELFAPAISDFVYVTDQTYNQQQILKMEIQILKTLDWNLSRPVAIYFLRRVAKAANVEIAQYAMSKYFLELAALEYELASCKPSEIAAAALFLSLHMIKGDPEVGSGFNDSLWNATLEHYSHYNAKHLRSTTRLIASLARRAPKTKLNAVYRKYQSSKLCKASLSPVLYSKLMDSIVESDDA